MNHITFGLYIACLDIKHVYRRLIRPYLLPAMIRVDKYRLRTNRINWIREEGQLTGIYTGTWPHKQLDRMMWRWAAIFNAHTIMRDNNDIAIFAHVGEDDTDVIIRGDYI